MRSRHQPLRSVLSWLAETLSMILSGGCGEPGLEPRPLDDPSQRRVLLRADVAAMGMADIVEGGLDEGGHPVDGEIRRDGLGLVPQHREDLEALRRLEGPAHRIARG